MVSTAGTGLPGAPEGSDVLVPGAKAGPWRVERELGRGGMGAVYAVVHDEIGKRAALKVVHQHLMPGFNSDRMLLEAKVVNQVGHPGIVDIFETGRLGDGRPYIVMERLYGQSLAVRAEQGKLLPDTVIAILLQVGDALIAAHAAGVVHRDLKLDNVFLIDNPDDPRAPRTKLLDWGIAKVIHHDVRHTIEGQLVGTPQYLSPEQARGHAVSPQSDVYSLGVMAYELFLEQLPFEAETAAEVMAMHLRKPPPPPCELWPDIPPALQSLLLAMLAKHPDDRPTMVEVARQLEAVRAALERRCSAAGGPRAVAAVGSGPMPPPIVVRAPSRARASSSAGISATQRFDWRSETRRWQYAIGGLALALSALLVWISRVGDRAAAAATAPEVIAGSAASRGVPPGETMPAAGPTAAELAAAPDRDPTAAGAATPRVGRLPIRSAAVEPAPPAPAIRPARADRPPVTASHASPRIVISGALGSSSASNPPSVSGPAPAPRSSVVPRRGTRVDPDGTLDVYR